MEPVSSLIGSGAGPQKLLGVTLMKSRRKPLDKGSPIAHTIDKKSWYESANNAVAPLLSAIPPISTDAILDTRSGLW